MRYNFQERSLSFIFPTDEIKKYYGNHTIKIKFADRKLAFTKYWMKLSIIEPYVKKIENIKDEEID